MLYIAELIEDIRFDNNSMCTSILFDLRKAFDTIDHSISHGKVEMYCVRGVGLDWFISYLNNRKQFVKVQGAESNSLTIFCGVLQGSIIGPLLFIIHINDIPSSCEGNIPELFADATNALYRLPRKQNKSNLDSLFFELVERMSQGKLFLNMMKTHLLHFSGCTASDLLICNQTIKSWHHVSCLGIIVDKRLNFQDHVSL